MKLFKKAGLVALVLSFLVAAPVAYAATSPGLGQASSFVILSSTYTNTVSGTTLTGDVGYTVPPVVTPTINGTTHVADTTYNQAGIDQGSALVALNSQPCSFTFAPGSIDLASDTTHGPVGVYTPGVYCITGAATIGGGGTVTLTGGGTYIFRMTGALTSTAGSIVALAGGASVCNIWWTPGAATTLGANSTFVGTDVDASGITIGNLANWTGRALAFGGTVTTSRNTMAVPPNCVTESAGSATGGSGNAVGLPNTGLSAPATNNSWLIVLAALIIAASSFYVVRKQRNSF